MKKDIFCMIVDGKAPSFKVYEDKNFIAVLDIYPNIEGQTLIISKKHMSGYVFDLSDKKLIELIVFTKKVVKLLEKKLNAKRVHIVIEGTGINHLHVKLYPAVGLKNKYAQVLAKDTKYFNKYEGYVTTLMGPRAKEKDLERVWRKIVK
ncbi:MAG: hypothetical protein BK997_01130 [Candidatus Micrarchaeum sp. ARMAN-1]|jgi:histidine triad (HIT) family protein|nr:MAG: hypothetical protein BK997_01130 [Candidatus Micrarchaeum sp. ARMAN-1]